MKRSLLQHSVHDPTVSRHQVRIMVLSHYKVTLLSLSHDHVLTISLCSNLLQNEFSQPLYHHVNIKWSVVYNLGWRRRGFEENMPGYVAKQYNNKLIITVHEYQKIMMLAEEGSADRHLFNVPETTPIQMNKKGMLVKARGSLEGQFCQPTGSDSMFNEGGLVEHIRIPATPSCSSKTAVVTPSPKSSDIGDRLCAKVREMTVALQHNPMAMEALFSQLSTMHEEILSGSAANMDAETLADLISFPATDSRKRGRRLKSAAEFDRKRMKQTETVELTMFSSRLEF